MNLKKIKNRVNEINEILNGSWKDIDSHSLITERAEKELILNKQGVHIRLTGNNKYYWGYQFAEFRKNINLYGSNYGYEGIDGLKISFHKYSINEDYSQYSNDLWRFDTPEEMKGFVKGYNALCAILKQLNKREK
jgi:hypothetical protein|tara:strand:+ start:106 stop:510 length:405 start_codon:yes stop_codon:yes gene_type:complete